MTLAHRVLGKKRIAEICSQCGLNESDRQMIDKLLVQWEKLIGQPVAKLQVALELTSGNSNRGKIIQAASVICVEFAKKQLAKQPPPPELN